MDQKVIVESLTKHLDALSSLFTWILLLAIPIVWTGIQRSDVVEALGIKVHRNKIVYVANGLYVLALALAFVILQRLSGLVDLLNDQNVLEGVTRLVTHDWLLNPFGYLGDQPEPLRLWVSTVNNSMVAM